MIRPRWFEELWNQDVLIQTSYWMARLHADDVSTEERASFERWRASSPHHARAYDELRATMALISEYRQVLRVFAYDS